MNFLGDNQTPPKPPDDRKKKDSFSTANPGTLTLENNTANEIPSFKVMLLKPYVNCQNNMEDMNIDDTEHLQEYKTFDSESHITLTTKDKKRIYTPWNFSVIIKSLGKS